MHLTNTFTFESWSIAYTVLTPSPSPPLKTLVFVHGTPWSSSVFTSLARSLLATRNDYEILLYDLPGYGQSQQTTTSGSAQLDTSVKMQASALAALLAHLDLQSAKPGVIAHDIAGSIVLRAHLLHGVEFEKMLLLDANAVLPWGDGFYKLCRAQPQVFLDLPANIFSAVVRAVIRSALHKPSQSWEDTLASPWKSGDGQKSFVRQIAQANDEDVREMEDGEMYARVKCDVTLLWGESDSWIPREKMERLNGLLGERGKGVITIPEAGHLVMVDQPERVTVEVVRWLGH